MGFVANSWKRISLYMSRKVPSSKWDTMRHIFSFLIFYTINAVALYLAQMQNFTTEQKFGAKQWEIVILGALILVILYYLHSYFKNKNREEKLKSADIGTHLIGGLIHKLLLLLQGNESEGTFTEALLRVVERWVKNILSLDGINGIEIVANLMVYSPETKTIDLLYFGTHAQDRHKIKLPIEKERYIPGAPTAFIYNEIVYIPNIHDEKFKNFFNTNSPYKSIISIPIRDENNNPWAILNIDSTKASVMKR